MRAFGLLACCVVLSSTHSFAAASAAASVTLDEVLVTGERPGPGMWRVSKGTHDLWILGTLEPLPKNMTWRAQAVDARIAASQVVIAPPRVTTNIGLLRRITLLPSLFRARKSPDGRTLEQTVPHDVYIRWLALRVKYLGNGGDEQLRPILAAFDLYTHAIDRAGLTDDDSVWASVEHTARSHHVPILPVTIVVRVDDPKGSIQDFNQIPEQAEIACLSRTIERVETDLQPMRQRANFWSLGDVAGLRTLPYPDEGLACFDAVLSVPKLREQVEPARLRMNEAWLAAAGDALDKNDSSFAALPITDLLKSNGWLDKFRAKGYTVRNP